MVRSGRAKGGANSNQLRRRKNIRKGGELTEEPTNLRWGGYYRFDTRHAPKWLQRCPDFVFVVSPVRAIQIMEKVKMDFAIVPIDDEL